MTIQDAVGGQTADLSFRQLATCEGNAAEEAIEVISRTVLNGGEYDESLPVGIYDLVASTAEKITQEIVDIEVEKDVTKVVNVSFD